jgi:hypothetical protein
MNSPNEHAGSMLFLLRDTRCRTLAVLITASLCFISATGQAAGPTAAAPEMQRVVEMIEKPPANIAGQQARIESLERATERFR